MDEERGRESEEMDRMATQVFIYIFKPPGGRRDGEECKDGDREKQITEG